MNEIDFKIPLTKFFMTDSSVVLNFEFPFDFNRRRCDMLIASKNEITGIEIKSDIDNLYRLDEQLKSYYTCFNKVYVACGQRHYKEISQIKGSFGIIYITQDSITIKRKAKTKKELNIFSILDMCDKSSLEKSTGLKSSSKADLIMGIMSTYKKSEIYSIHHKAIYEKVSKIYDTFISEKGEIITREDITLLSLKSMSLGSI
ncbi:sce7726 family protein [Citrobacter amalonaticus]|uniref:sce7726 family protein n=1 Tax=Citrobacter amalonaticus TaxID=35703 RepID=UPI001A35030D|nr:sce7726 family protein [Citrobacter amalonaticus]HDQ2811412.1 sce7726 family protein [Citrobacter amalonaticus]